MNIWMIWEKVSENSLPLKEAFYRHLNMKDITDSNYMHVKKFWNKKFTGKSWFVCSKQYF